MTTHEAHFRPRARILDLLGDQLIRDHRIALFELVKNAYDADSPDILLRFINIQRKDGGAIEVRDSGEGMDLDTVLNVWLEPASDHKALRRARGERSPLYGRLPVGEKGVGRFAVQKLGRRLTMVSRKQGQLELALEIDWGAVAGHKYLEEFPVQVVEREPEMFRGNRHGTWLRIDGLRQVWTRGDVRRLHRNVNAMVSPFKGQDSFKVRMEIEPQTDWLDDLFCATDAPKYAFYHFAFVLDDSSLSWHYRYTPFDSFVRDYPGLIKPRQQDVERDDSFEFFRIGPPPPEGGGWTRRKPRPHGKPVKLRWDAERKTGLGIGPISCQLSCFDLDPKIKPRIHDLNGLEQFLRDQGGVRVYRDGMRVYDYGEPGNDWLGLDVRRVNAPVDKLSNNLLLAEIHLDLASSPRLIEKTSREGFVENDAYRELWYAIRCALIQFEAERSRDKKDMREAFKTKGKGDVTGIEDPGIAIEALRRRVVEKNLSTELGSYVDRVKRTYEAARDVLMSSVGAGLGLALVFHEIVRGVRGLTKALENGEDFEKLIQMSRQLTEMLEGSLVLVRKGEGETLTAAKLCSYAMLANLPRCNYHHIRFINGFERNASADFPIKGERRILTAALANLIDNAIHWINTARDHDDPGRCLWVGPSHDLEGPAIVVGDSGPGFRDVPADVIRPFFTRREDGMGLGLYFSNMAMTGHDGRLCFPSRADVGAPQECTGAIVAMVFPRKS